MKEVCIDKAKLTSCELILFYNKFSRLISSDYSIVKPFKNLNIGRLETITIKSETELTNDNNHLKYSTSLSKKNQNYTRNLSNKRVEK